MAYISVRLKDSVAVRKIISIHYFQYGSDFTFPGESHDFWELICVDRGELDVIDGEERISLKTGNLLFHAPGVFHNILPNGRQSPSLVVIGFECGSRLLKSFENRVMEVGETEKELLARIIIEARNTFRGRLDNPYQQELVFRREPLSFASAQMIRLYMEQLLICLYRRYCLRPLPVSTSFWGQETTVPKNDAFHRILRYMEEHIDKRLTVEQICRDNLLSASRLQKLFHAAAGCGAMEYFSRMKIEAAKEMIRENQQSFTQIADRLGYSSIHYFSRQFKQISSMSPTEYARSIQSLSEPPEQTVTQNELP